MDDIEKDLTTLRLIVVDTLIKQRFWYEQLEET